MKKHKDEVLVFCFSMLVLLGFVLNRYLASLDELWIFNFSRNIVDGLIPYTDFNMIITPALAYIGALFLKVFGTELIVFRILTCILGAFIFLFSYKILKLLNINKYVSYLFIIAYIALVFSFIDYNYNWFIILITVITLYLELKNYLKNEDIFYTKGFLNEFLLGACIALTILFKQTMGIVLTICFCFYKIFAVRSKNDFKSFLKIAIFRFLGALVPIAILILYLVLNGNYLDFINYAILGLSSFTNSISYIEFILSEDIIFVILALVILVFLFINGIVKGNKIYIILFSFSIASFIGVFPIVEPSHFYPFALIIFIAGIYILQNITGFSESKEKSKSEGPIKILTYVIVIIICILSIVLIIFYLINCSNYTRFDHYKFILTIDGLANDIVQIDDFIISNDNEVYILDADAAVFMIPIDRYNKDYDMLNIGNLGRDGISNIIKELDERDDLTLLIQTDLSNINWQTPTEILDYVIDNYNEVGTVCFFTIYEK